MMFTKILSASTTIRGQCALNRVGTGVEWSGGAFPYISPDCAAVDVSFHAVWA